MIAVVCVECSVLARWCLCHGMTGDHMIVKLFQFHVKHWGLQGSAREWADDLKPWLSVIEFVS